MTLASLRAQLLQLRRDPEARAELERALAGLEAQGQADDAARIRHLLAQLDAMRS